ncbi:hypothetical protein K2173_015495 [Erythroxylum novogranatense]|uniref:DUF7722 domain-containing protein n=1 Tax=Erythroxylum novogranatense TaxID=1862640 RepID=A0AAV8SSQ8_9ROSI|nr:hypothetical protein K2173_015495 [Erythroxylum novogranatense]
MALKWFLNSAFTQVFSHTDTTSLQRHEVIACPPDHHGHVQDCAKTRKEGAPKIGGRKETCPSGFQMPLHYPKYTKTDYEKMEEWKLDVLLNEYGLSSKGNLDEKRAFAKGAFLWPDQL